MNAWLLMAMMAACVLSIPDPVFTFVTAIWDYHRLGGYEQDMLGLLLSTDDNLIIFGDENNR